MIQAIVTGDLTRLKGGACYKDMKFRRMQPETY